jgi:hypothetical protein
VPWGCAKAPNREGALHDVLGKLDRPRRRMMMQALAGITPTL